VKSICVQVSGGVVKASSSSTRITGPVHASEVVPGKTNGLSIGGGGGGGALARRRQAGGH
jgi:hypothetical protein